MSARRSVGARNVARAARALALVLCSSGAMALSPAQLETMIDSDDTDSRVVVIDVRSRAEFSGGHIPGSLNIPSAGLDKRPMAPFGRVVVVWDGIDQAAAERDVAALNGKPGIQAELLEGGYPAWSASRSSGGTGLLPGGPLTLTYDELAGLKTRSNVAVIDLRSGADGAALTDIRVALPSARVIGPSPSERAGMRAQAAEKTARGVPGRAVPLWLRQYRLDGNTLYVLVDDGDARQAEVVAQALQAHGLGRVFVVTGGEKALRSRGQPTEITRTSGESGGN